MRLFPTIVAATAIAALAACGDPAPQAPAPPATEDVAERLETLPEGQRNAVFIRAIQDARQQCQHVESSERAGEHEGRPVWNATCEGGGTWSIVVMSDGTAAVLNAQAGGAGPPQNGQ